MKGLKYNKKQWNDDLSQVAWDKFEAIIADHYKMQGYRVTHVGTGGTNAKFDGGIDLKLYKGDKYTIVQCKRWNVYQVPHDVVHQLIGKMVTEKADFGIFVTSGEYTAAARSAAAKYGKIELIDGVILRQRLGNVVDSMRKPDDSNHSKLRDEVEYRKPIEPRKPTELWKPGKPVEARKPAEPRKHDEPKSFQFEYENSKRPWKRNRKSELTTEHFIFKFVVPILFLIFALKIIPSIFSGLIKRPEAAAVSSQVLQAPMQIKPANTQNRTARPSNVHWNSTRPMSQSPTAKLSVERIAPNNDAIAPMDMKEWERRNRESMKVLENTTPELKQ